MTDLVTVLESHDWSLDGYATRPQLDQLMKSHADVAEANTLWEQHCPWSKTNGGYIAWALTSLSKGAKS